MWRPTLYPAIFHGRTRYPAPAAAADELPCLPAAAQIRFTDFHAAASVCTPSRAGLLTGRYGMRTGISGNFGPQSKYGLAAQELTIADVLSDAGFQTHMWELAKRRHRRLALRSGIPGLLGFPPATRSPYVSSQDRKVAPRPQRRVPPNLPGIPVVLWPSVLW